MTSLLCISHRLKLRAGRVRIKPQTSVNEFELLLVVIQSLKAKRRWSPKHALMHGAEVAAMGDAGYQGVEKRE